MTSSASASKIDPAPFSNSNITLDASIRVLKPEIDIITHIISCYPFAKAFSNHSDTVPIGLLEQVGNSASYDKASQTVFFTINDVSFSVTKATLQSLLELPSYDESILEFPKDEDIRNLFLSLGYSGSLDVLSSFNPSHLPVSWGYLIVVITRCLSGKTGSLEQLSANWARFAYAFITGAKVDVIQIIWEDF